MKIKMCRIRIHITVIRREPHWQQTKLPVAANYQSKWQLLIVLTKYLPPDPHFPSFTPAPPLILDTVLESV